MPSSSVDILIISTSTQAQCIYWQRRLAVAPRLGLTLPDRLFVVCEEWPNGAGNGLGTLHAIQQAQLHMAKERLSLIDALHKGASAALIHTAGQGKRLAPLTLAEANNKSSVQLPAAYTETTHEPRLTILEAVIKQIMQQQSYPGRLSVYWGDQLFTAENKPIQSHIAVASIAIPTPSLSQWESCHYSRYGIIATSRFGEDAHLDKVSYEALHKWQQEHPFDGLALSLGSFSLSSMLLEQLLLEFTPELNERKKKIDIEPGLFMPTTLSIDNYLKVIKEREDATDYKAAKDHFERMNLLKERVMADSDLSFYKALHLGENAFWWDFGTLSAYYENLHEMVYEGVSRGVALKEFIKAFSEQAPSTVDSDQSSIFSNCHISSGRVRRSLLIDVDVPFIDVEDCLVIGVKAPSLTAQHALIYHYQAEKDITLNPFEVLTSVNLKDDSLPITTNLERNGKEDWYQPVNNNQYSYDSLQTLINKSLNLISS